MDMELRAAIAESSYGISHLGAYALARLRRPLRMGIILHGNSLFSVELSHGIDLPRRLRLQPPVLTSHPSLSHQGRGGDMEAAVRKYLPKDEQVNAPQAREPRTY